MNWGTFEFDNDKIDMLGVGLKIEFEWIDYI